MKLNQECVTCIIAQVRTVSDMLQLSEPKKQEAMRDTIGYLGAANYEGCTPESMGELWQILLGHVGEADPYASIKSQCNREAMKMVPATREKILRAKDPLTTALKYAIAGNLIDYGLEHPVSIDDQNEQIDAIAESPFARDDSEALRKAISQAETMLYLGDNAGEIVFDKLLIEEIQREYPQVQISFVVKGSAVLNDVTRTDALEVGMDTVARIVDNGDCAPGTVLPRTSKEFRAEFDAADVILSKGQGNFESLNEEKKKGLFFLFTAKCDSVCAEVNVAKLSVVCLENHNV